MKLSLAWIFDHIESDWRAHDIDDIVAKFNNVTAEIESYSHVSYDLSSFFLGWVVSVSSTSVTLKVPSLQKTVELDRRDDLTQLDDQLKQTHACIIIGEPDESFRWATCQDLQLDKPGNLPLVYAREDQAESWKDSFETQDIILEVDNKSITHRPDMWGHRGFAREIAAFMDLKLRPASSFLADVPHKSYDQTITPSTDSPLSVLNQAPERCLRFSGLYCSSITMQPSSLSMLSRLLKVGSRGINAVVDITNYVMLDWSQPMHAFDAESIDEGSLTIRLARTAEKLTLLDDTTIELTDEDLVVADASGPMALAGVMGGKHDSIGDNTRAVYLESAHFTPTGIRKSAARHKVRTEASARFEKKLDPMQTSQAIQRFIALADSCNITMTHAQAITSLGQEFAPLVITVDKSWLDARSGFDLTTEHVVTPLERIGFSVEETADAYKVSIPCFRAAKDVTGPEDILEEILRLYGFDKIKSKLPALRAPAKSLSGLYRERQVKNILSYAAGMLEQVNYPLFDEKLLKQIDWQPSEDCLAVVNPVSSNQVRLVTSLVPHLVKNVLDNYARSDTLAFYEVANQWHPTTHAEEKYISGIFFDKRGHVDFYEKKAHLSRLFCALGLDVQWQKTSDKLYPWYAPHQTAQLVVGDTVIGYAGMVDPLFISKLDVLEQSNAFVFEIAASYLTDQADSPAHYKPISKYQENDFDISFMVPRSLTVAVMQEAISAIDSRVVGVELFDFFEKKSFGDQRAIAFHVTLSDHDRMLEKHEIDHLRLQSIAVIEKLGGVLRG